MSELALSLSGVGLTLPWRLRLNLKSIREKKRVLSNITFSVRKGEVVALVGRNGCGKSTLFKIISGIYMPTEGRLDIGGSGEVSVMALSMGFMPPLTGRENVVLQGLISGMNHRQAKAAADQTLEDLRNTQIAVDGRYDMPYSTYSAGMKAMIASSSALLKNADVILVDEVFGVGDEVYRRDLTQKLRERAAKGAAVLVVSHDQGVLRNLCERAIVLDQGTLVSDDMSVDAAIQYVSRKE